MYASYRAWGREGGGAETGRGERAVCEGEHSLVAMSRRQRRMGCERQLKDACKDGWVRSLYEERIRARKKHGRDTRSDRITERRG